jgi:hypothetical protein
VREKCGCGEGGCVYATLMGSDAVEPSGRAEGGTGPGRTRLKPKASYTSSLRPHASSFIILKRLRPHTLVA